MKIVIDILEKEYELIRHGNKSSLTELELMRAVANGTPLPEGHGRLIDVDELLNTNIDTFSQQTELKIKFAPTIIEGSNSK